MKERRQAYEENSEFKLLQKKEQEKEKVNIEKDEEKIEIEEVRNSQSVTIFNETYILDIKTNP